MAHRVRVLIADDQRSTRQGLVALLALFPEVELIGEAADGRQTVQMVSEHRPDVVVMDLQMPLMDGLEATRLIKNQWPETRVIALTMFSRYKAEALAAGVDAFLLKGGASETLVETIRNREKVDQEL